MADEHCRMVEKIEGKGLTRRQLLTGAAAAAATFAASSVVGCAPNAQEVSTDMAPAATSGIQVVPADSEWAMPDYVAVPDETLSADLVVVGSGMGGMTACLTAQERGLSVIVVERAAALGGGSAFAEGCFAVNTPFLAALGFEDVDVDTILQKEFEWHHYICDATLWQTVIRNNPEDFQWLQDQGVVIVETGGGRYGSVPTQHMYEGHRGKNAIRVMAELAVSRGGQILSDTRATHMLMTDDAVAGVQCVNRGRVLNISAPAVVLATGGAGGNKDMIEQWTNRNTDNQYWLGCPTATGDGIALAVEAGMGKPYRLGGPGLGACVEPLDLNSHFGTAAAVESMDLWVNQDGKRFFNEDKTVTFFAPLNAIESQCKTFSIFDQGIMDHYINDGCDVGWAKYCRAGTKLVDAMDECERELASGNPYVFKANTLEDLVTQMGLPVTTTLATIEEYNGFCRKGADPVFYKDPYFLRQISTAPFYGARLKGAVVSQKGGVHCNSSGEVITREGKIIPGLFVAGLDCGGFQSQTTGITIPGSVQGYALGMGRQCGRSAADYVKA